MIDLRRIAMSNISAKEKLFLKVSILYLLLVISIVVSILTFNQNNVFVISGLVFIFSIWMFLCMCYFENMDKD
jgi:hypothetical protein